MRYHPRLRLYLIADNLSTHKTPAIHEWAAGANTELVFTPTYASFLNRIECHFWGIGEFVINNADHHSWDALARPWPTTSATATALTATNASSPPNASS
jgi:transposase